MLEQTPINKLNGTRWGSRAENHTDHTEHEMSNVKQLISDITELVELQTRLMEDDMRS